MEICVLQAGTFGDICNGVKRKTKTNITISVQ